MVIDASSLLAILLEESDADYHEAKIKSAAELWISPVNWWEVQVRMFRSLGQGGEPIVALYLSKLSIKVVPIDAEQASLAFAAFQRFGRSPARLNMGDCFAYALAKQKALPLLFKGNDFAATDVKVA